MTNATPQTPEADALAADVDALAGTAAADVTEVTLGGHKFTVRPMRVAQFFPFLKLARPMLAALVNRPSSPPAGLPPPGGADDQGGSSTGVVLDAAALRDAEWMLDLIETHGPELVRALAVGVDCNPEAIEALTLPDLFTLLKHFLVVNADFLKARGLVLPPGLLLQPNPLAAGVAAAVAGTPSS